jgi:ankyrin repeat protein
METVPHCTYFVMCWEQTASSIYRAIENHTSVPLVTDREMDDVLMYNGISRDCTIDFEGFSLRAATENSHADVVAILLHAGNNMKGTHMLAPALKRACELGHSGWLARVAGAYGSQFFAFNPSRLVCATWLNEAARNGHTKVVEELFKMGNYDEWTCKEAHHLAISNGHHDLAKLLQSRHGELSKDESLVYSAEKGGSAEDVIRLLQEGADVHFHDDDALLYALTHGRLDIAKILVQHGANVNAKRGTFLAQASANGNVEMLQLLLDNGAEINACEGCAIGAACSSDNVDNVRFLLRHGADILPILKKTYLCRAYLNSDIVHTSVVQHLLKSNELF